MGAVAVPFGVLQLLSSPPRTNPPIIPAHTIGANLSVPAPVSHIIHQVCANCHSNETRWPWYSHVAPFSWMLTNDVNNARAAMNFSEWSTQLDGIGGAGVAKLAVACAVLTADIMPPQRYQLMHPEARLSAAQKQAFCNWTTALAVAARKSRADAAQASEPER
jgi:hypothetical protein